MVISNFFFNSQRYSQLKLANFPRVSMTQAAILPLVQLVSTIPAVNLPLVSTTPVANCHRNQLTLYKSWRNKAQYSKPTRFLSPSCMYWNLFCCFISTKTTDLSSTKSILLKNFPKLSLRTFYMSLAMSLCPAENVLCIEKEGAKVSSLNTRTLMPTR